MSRFPDSVRFEYKQAHSSNFTAGTWRKDHITMHWWDLPSKRPQFDGVVSWFQNPQANVSIQYMVEDNRITQMIPESAMAWHAGNSHANRHGIGIEVNPRLSDGDYETTAVLVAEIWRRRGRKLPLRRHREFTTTSCPGTLDVARVQRRAEQLYTGQGSLATVVTAPAKEKTMSLTGKNIKDITQAVMEDRSYNLNGNNNTFGWKVANTNRRVEQVNQKVNQLQRSVSYLGRQNAQISTELRELKAALLEDESSQKEQ